ncbi:ATP-dependent zinc protease [Candidatus Saccharibacteria bacterium]|nr:ATP-dependent zinc protease [Candidatus Saccharibacteria bacterium]
METGLETIGRDAFVDIVGIAEHIPAKIDTGADGSAIWASDIHVEEDGQLAFRLFAPHSPLYTGQIIRCKNYNTVEVRSASGHLVRKYKVVFRVRLGDQEFETDFGLSDRAKMNYPILIGRRSLHGRFIVDVSKEVNATKGDDV